MALILSEIRSRFEQILFEGYGYARTIPTGVFRKVAPDLDGSQASAERRARLFISGFVELDGPANPLDSFAIVARTLTVQVEYVRTGAGSDLAEGYDQLNGGADDETIADRMAHDEHVIRSAFCWYENFGGLDPNVFSCVHAERSDEYAEGVAVMSVSFTLGINEPTPGAYAP